MRNKQAGGGGWRRVEGGGYIATQEEPLPQNMIQTFIRYFINEIMTKKKELIK